MDTKFGQIRQGDILLVPVENVTPPENAVSHLAVTLAEGEMTGHAHVLSAEAGVVAWEDMVWVVGDAPGELTHQEHDPTPAAVVTPGIAYRVVHQREFTLAEQWQRVQD